MKNWRRNYETENDDAWIEAPDEDVREKRLKRFRKKRKRDRDSLEKRSPRVRSTWEEHVHEVTGNIFARPGKKEPGACRL